VSDQLLSAADGMLDALVDSAISVRDVDAYAGATGLPYPDAGDSLNDMLRYARLRRAVADLFDAVGRTLDCMAAVPIVVTRAPLSVQRADFAQLSNLDPGKAYAGAFVEPVPQVQRDLWAELVAELRAHERTTDGIGREDLRKSRRFGTPNAVICIVVSPKKHRWVYRRCFTV
jgi:hypothetical protein